MIKVIFVSYKFLKRKRFLKTHISIMALIKSISGIRGTIGGKSGEGLSPLDVVKFTAAFATFIAKGSKNKKIKIVFVFFRGRPWSICSLFISADV